MRFLRILLCCATLLAFPHRTIAQDNSQEQAVRKVIEEFVEAINAGDTKAFAALFTEDADFVVITGKYLKSRNEIVTYHAGLFTASFKASHLDVTSVAVRFLRPDITVARVGTKRTENAGKEMRTSFPMFVLTQQGKSWLIAAVQNTLTGGDPVPPAGAPAVASASWSNVQSTEDEQAIQKVVADATECWNRQDKNCRARTFAEDADAVFISGGYFKGRDEIEKHMAASHAGIYKDSHLREAWAAVRSLRPDVAIAREATELTYNEGKDKRTSFAILVLTKEAGQWLIAAFQNTLTGETPDRRWETTRSPAPRPLNAVAGGIEGNRAAVGKLIDPATLK